MGLILGACPSYHHFLLDTSIVANIKNAIVVGVLVLAQVMKCQLAEDLHSKNLNVLIIGLISGGRGGGGEGGGEGGGGEVVIWRLVAGPCGAAMGIAATPSPTKPCSSIAAQLQTRCTLPCDPQLLQVHPAHHLLLTPPPLPASPPAMSSSGRCRQLSQCVGGRPQYSQCRPQ